jgi:hypothetical protein
LNNTLEGEYETEILKQGQSDIKILRFIQFPWLETGESQITAEPIVMQMN